MNNHTENFLNYLLDSETTSEIAFIETIQKNSGLFQSRHLKDWEQTVSRHLQQVHGNTTISPLNNESPHSPKSDGENSDDEVASSPSEDEKTSEDGHTQRSTKTTDIYVDTARQCQRLLRLLYYFQQHQPDFSELYFHTLEQFIRSDSEKIITVVLQQIATHLFEGTNNANDRQRLIQYISSKTPFFRNLPAYQPVSATIQTLLSTPDLNFPSFLSNHVDILYPYSARFLDVRREFRDTTRYFIDGDSLLLSIVHHSNIHLHSYFGNTLHTIFIIERILLTLFHQSHQCNYTLVFFDCHHQLYQQENAILSLLRSCLIVHFSKNAHQNDRVQLQQFSSWLDDDYLKFTHDEKPMFVLYHDLSNFDGENNRLLSKDTLEKLLCFYRLFGNYHQYVVQCQLYLMNKLILTETTVKCFQIQFYRMFSKKLIDQIVQTVRSDLPCANGIHEQNWSEYESVCQESGDNDVRLFLYLKTITRFIEDQNQQYLVSLLSPLFILHVALLIRLSLVDRHLPFNFPSVTYSPGLSQLIVRFQQQLALHVSSSSSSSTLSWSKIADLFDGRLFTFTLCQIQQSSTIRLDSKTSQIIEQSLSLLNIPSGEHRFQDIVNQLIQSNDLIFPSPIPKDQQTTIEQRHRKQVFRISNPLIDTYLKPILSSKDPLSLQLVPPDDRQIIRYKNKSSWRTYKDVGDEIGRIRDNDADRMKPTNHRYRTKELQKLYDYFTLYGKSLTTRDVRDNQLQIVLPTASTPARVNQELSPAGMDSPVAGGKKKQQHKNQPKKVQPTKAEVIIEQNNKRMMDKRTDDETDKVKNVESRLKQIPADNYAEAIELIEESLPNFETSVKRLELLKRKFEFQRKYLRSFRKKSNLSIEEASKLELLQIGFFATLCEMAHLENIVDAFVKTKKYMEELVNDPTLDAEKWYRFQLEKINSRLPRREQGLPDERVPDFIPDDWQVKFLDAVDKRQSIIIVAPTASGKTYASYYAMGKVLKDKDDTNGICVYIAPTKALINQVAGTIHSKFGPVFGVFTQDYRMNLPTCRVLVTVPECLEMLLLSPTYQRWCQRIRYCIFDEIHCMSGDIGSDVWERTMLLINCPMIGLSATVNNGKSLEQWIVKVEQERYKLFRTSSPRQVCLISHYERLADLNKYLYSNRQLHPLHPIGLMNAKQLTSRGVPNDFSLSPYETLRLNDAMQKTNGINRSIPTLTDHFSPGWIAERTACNTYSNLVRDQFKELIHTNQNAAIDSISTSLNPIAESKISYPELKPMAALIGEFVLTLREKNLLPCIVFTNSRALCEELAESVTQYFEGLENELRRTKYQHQIEALQKRLIQIEKAEKSAKAKRVVKTTQKRGNDDEDGEPNDNPAELQQMEEEDKSQLRLSGYEQDLLYGILEEGTLANRRHCDRELVDRLIARAETVNPRLVRYLKRGVAYHHHKLNNRGRLAVEGLFRNRYVQIIFSTWTLALGIHMPTKTVAFVKDSIELDALQYRQSSGRAGRRGFDVQGNIVFIDIPMSKIRHLTISAIPNIQTHSPTSVTFLMRLLHFYSNAEDKNDAINRSLVALQCPFNAQSTQTHRLIDLQIRYHCLHTLDFLYRLNLMDDEGNLLGLAGFSTHLHHFEPASILFAYLIDTRLFHEMNDEEEIVNLLAYLFTSMPLSTMRQPVNDEKATQRNSLFNSKLALRPISADVRQRIQSYNALVKEVYGGYIENLIEKIRSTNDGQEHSLPLSNVSFHQSSDYDNGTFEYQLHHHHSQQSQNPSISPFAAPSGLTHERFISNYNPSSASWDLAYDLDLSPRIVPYVDIDTCDHTNSSYYLNSYALDFFKHGSERFLLTENQLDRGETYNLLFDFNFLLTSIKRSLDHLFENEPKQSPNDSPFFRPIGKKLGDIQEQLSNKFYKEFK